jgi:hypothetical protein
MSVIYFSDSELSRLYENLADMLERGKIDISSKEENLWHFIARIGLCNRLAYHLTYPDKSGQVNLKIPNFKTEDDTEMSLKQLLEKLSLLEYNCITNSGRCFMDTDDNTLLRQIIDRLSWRYIRHLEWQSKNKKS